MPKTIKIMLVLICIISLSSCGKDKLYTVKGKVVFVSDRFKITKKVLFGNQGMCLYEDGKITPLYKGFFDLRWSPDGTKIVAIDLHNDNVPDIVLVDLMKNNVERRVVNYYASEFAWFPDNKRIAAAGMKSMKENKYLTKDIYIYNIETSEEIQLTHFGKEYATIDSVDVSPDGKKIIFTRSEKLGWSKTWMYMMDADGSNMVKTSIRASQIRWSPDGKKILFTSDHINGTGEQMNLKGELFIYDVNTKEVKRITYNNIGEEEPIFSPDGSQIMYVRWDFKPRLFSNVVDVGKSLWVMDIDGKNERQVIPPGHEILDIDWTK